jgi:hypothetical protein
MDRTAVQHASIAAEAINGLNTSTLATLNGADDADLTRLKDAYDVVCSLKLLSQRLVLTAGELGKIVAGWHEEGHLRTAPAEDPDALVANFGKAVADAGAAAREAWFAYERASASLTPMGWQEAAPAPAEPQ